MTRLTFDALNEKAEQVANEELLSKVSGGKKEDCHDLIELETVTIYGSDF